MVIGKNNFLRVGISSAILLMLLLLFFPGQALQTDGVFLRCIRFIKMPFLFGAIEVPGWYPRVFAGVFMLLALVTLIAFVLAWRRSKCT